MFHKTKGVVLHSTEYSETSLIVKILTREFGLQAYIIKGGRSKKSKQKANLFQPLTLVTLEVTHSNQNKLERIAEMNVSFPYNHIPFDMMKRSIAIFINEVIYKSLQEGHTDEAIFDYIEETLQLLDEKEESCSNFHILFMLGLSHYLGFYPHGRYSENTNYLDLQEGRFTNQQPVHAYYVTNKTGMLLNNFLDATYETVHFISLDRTERKQLLNTLILFYQLHIESFKTLKSLEILQQVIE